MTGEECRCTAAVLWGFTVAFCARGILIILRAAHGDPDRIARAPGARSIVRIVRRRLSFIIWGAPGARELCL